jgi:glutamate/tyrosine decarboxylase-like PLP-dependent enzyme
VHRQDALTEVLTQAVIRYAVDRMRMDPVPLDRPRTEAELRAMAGRTVTPDGIGGLEALRVFSDVLAPACISTDHPRYLAFVPAAPTESAILFDLVVGASCIYGGSWLEGAGAVFAENEALQWLADVAGLPSGAGGVFVTGGSAGNLGGLVAARHTWRTATPGADRVRGIVVAGAGAHSSIAQAARVMDADVVAVPGDERGRLTGPALRDVLDGLDPADAARVFCVVATGGTTNAGIVDDLASVADVCDERGIWLHVDCAYGGGAMVAPSVRHLFDGIERCDSFVTDPHKWLFAPFDCAALLYRDPALARAAHTQHAEYLDVLTESHEWNPSDYAYHLTRRARGLPFWFSLATHGTRRYAEGVEATLAAARQAAALVDAAPHVELVAEPELSVVLFRRVGWTPEQLQAWSDRVLLEGLTLTVPTQWQGETVLRWCFVNPRTSVDDVRLILDSLAGHP